MTSFAILETFENHPYLVKKNIIKNLNFLTVQVNRKNWPNMDKHRP